MKLFKGVFFTALAVVALMSCSKDEGTKGIAGTWEGNWGFDTDTPTYFERWVIEKNGDLKAYKSNGDLYATGDWELEGASFTMEYSPVGKIYSYSFEGTYDSDSDVITGSWGEWPSTTDGGTFEMFKK